jgi:hypothetical protein
MTVFKSELLLPLLAPIVNNTLASRLVNYQANQRLDSCMSVHVVPHAP